jgi:hypothetical protein
MRTQRYASMATGYQSSYNTAINDASWKLRQCSSMNAQQAAKGNLGTLLYHPVP